MKQLVIVCFIVVGIIAFVRFTFWPIPWKEAPKYRNEIVIDKDRIFVYGEDGENNRLLEGQMKYPIELTKSGNTVYVTSWVPEKGTNWSNKAAVVRLFLDREKDKKVYDSMLNILVSKGNLVYDRTIDAPADTKIQISLYIY